MRDWKTLSNADYSIFHMDGYGAKTISFIVSPSIYVGELAWGMQQRVKWLSGMHD